MKRRSVPVDMLPVGADARRIVILSDTHLGKPRGGAGSAAALRALWRGADQLIINGDTAEMHDHTRRVEAARQIIAIQDMCQEEDVELTLLPGNHDPFISDTRHLRLYDGAVFVTHGDAIHPAISPWNSNRAQLRHLHEQAIASLDEDARRELGEQLSAAQFASHFKWDHMANHPGRPQPIWRRVGEQAMKAAAALWYWHTLPHAAARFARERAPDCRFFIFGHIHRAGIWRLDGRTIINTGSYTFPSRPRAVVIQHGELSVWPILSHVRGYCLAPAPIARFDIAAQRAAA